MTDAYAFAAKTAMPRRSMATTLLGVLAGAATVVVIIGATVTVFLNPLWIGLAQERAGVPAITGYSPEQVRAVTGSILVDLVFGPPEFAVTVDGRPVLDSSERSHMVDVRDVLLAVTAVFGVAVAVMVLLLAMTGRRAWVWRAVARGSGTLVLFGMVAGVAVVFFFDAAFLLFHRAFFPQGNFAFDPRTQRLTQLFPEQLFIETSTGIAIVGLAIATAVTLLARHRAVRLPD